jgi:hypothetical protein
MTRCFLFSFSSRRVSDAVVRRTSAAPAAALLLVTGLAACAPARPPPPLPPKPLERSSVDVLLRNRGELELTDDQVLRLEALDEAREGEAAALRTQLAERKRAATEQAAGDRPADIGTGSGRTGANPGSARGMGSSAGPGRGGRTPPLGGKKDEALARLRDRIDAADTRAYRLAVTEVLTHAQREKADRLASAYREALFDYREALRLRGGSPPED